MEKRWVLYVFLVFFLLAAALGLYVYLFTQRGLPVTSGTIEAAVQNPVQIYRDEYGIPHIIAENLNDMCFAQGYVHAQDRMWQMDMNRRGVGGKLSEVIGEDGVETDQFTLTVGFLRAAENNYRLLSPEAKEALEAYAAGVNAYLEDNRGQLSPEFSILGYEPDPWQPLDSLSIAVYMAWYLGGNMDAELFHTALIEQVGLELAGEMFPDYPDYGPIIAPQLQGETVFTKEDVPELIRLARIAELGGRTRYVPGLGSNNWVISGELAPGKGAILANDMHLAMGLPSIWHCSHLIVKNRFNVTGVMFPGIPGIIAGFNEHLAWGFTNTGPDVQDLYLLEVNPGNSSQYLYMDEWQDADIIIEEYLVKGESEPRQLEVMVTRFGPEISSIVNLEVPLCLRWTALEGTRELDAVLGMMDSRNWEEFTMVMENFMAPTQNVVYADREGNIGYRANGLIPIRRSGDGLLPADGTTDQYEWIGYIDWEELPTLYNPPEAIIVTANHRVVDDDYPYFISSSWAPPYRASGIWHELGDKPIYKIDDMIRAQTSYYNSQAALLGPVFVSDLKAANLDTLELKALSIFEEWLQNPVENADLAGPAIYNVLYMNMQKRTFADEMGLELYERFLHNRGSVNAFDRMILSGDSGWFNNINTNEPETRGDIVYLAFIDTVAYLQETLGGDPLNWKWGDLHTITFNHNMGSVDILARFFNRGPFPVGGSFHTPANMSYQMTNPFGVTHSAPWRFIVDMSTHEAYDALAIGNSGHLFSPHYDDQAGMWVEGSYKKMIFEPEVVRLLDELLVLEPRL